MTARPEYPKVDEAEGKDLKNTFVKKTEVLKEEIKNSFKEIEEKTTKNWSKPKFP